MSSPSPRDRLPFEPQQKKKKSLKQPPLKSQATISAAEPENAENASLKSIPEAVSKRMARRMAIFSGIPTALGMSSFFIFYWLVSQGQVKIPSAVVGAVSIGLFGLGVLGLSYGIFSASWQEERIGGWWGWKEFKVNFGRTINAWRSAGKEAPKN